MALPTKKRVLLLISCCLVLEGVKGVEKGKLDIQQVDGFHCEPVYFSSSFSSGTPVRVFASINHGNEPSKVHDSAFVWVEDVTTNHFQACIFQGGWGFSRNATLDWFAFQGSQSGVHHGEVTFSLFTTGTKCNLVAFPQAFSSVPKVQVTVKHGIPNQKQDAMSVWIDSVTTSQFEVCLQESRTFDGPHSNLVVSWMAYEHYPASWEAKQSSEVFFSQNEGPTAENNHSLCKNVSFTSPFYGSPVILTTVLNGGGNNDNIACPVEVGPLSSWLEEVTKSYFRVCIKDNAGYGGQRSDVIVDYIVVGDLHPCTNVSCKYHSHCVASSPHQFSCVCESSCPSYEEQVCASNGQTFTNLCLLKQEICLTQGNYTNYHPGSCTGFPLQKGRHKFQNVPSWAEDQCEIIKFEPYIFYPHKKIYIQLTVNHVNYSDAAYVHEATTPWVESVNNTQFTACVTRAGRNDYPSDSFATVDWIAYQGAPPGGMTGEKIFSRWWTGTSCQTVTFPNGKYSYSPTVIATAEHYKSGLKHDATSLWLEDVSSSSFKICLREIQNFAGVHDDISVSWLAFDSLHRPLFREHSDVSFLNDVLPSKDHNFAFCEDVNFIHNYSKAPTILLTATHSSSIGSVAAECNGIIGWIEFITNSGFRICVKEVFAQRFDPVAVSYAVLSDICQDDWTYFKGYCYSKVSSCDSWSGSQGTCATLGANLPSIHSQEENVYVQNIHGGEQSWLGLSDINTEGTFVWSDGAPYDFQDWARGQPNNFNDEDCVHTLGFLENHKYEWNDVNCTDCHRFTCKKDYDECSDYTYDCPVGASCVNSDGSYSCACPSGYPLHGNNCAAFSAVFTNLNASGRYGPMTLGSHYTGQDHDGQVTLSSGIQLWTVPYSGDYRIEAVGAAGGYDTQDNTSQHRGRGARMIGTFNLWQGEVIQILVGQEGGINKIKYGSGGGGGTFVVRGSNTPLIIAGGGGGVDTVSSRHAGCDANVSTAGNPGYRSWSGGSNGHGAQTANNGDSGGGGGGFYSSGRSGMNFNGTIGNGGEGGEGFFQGGVGGRAYQNNVDGGFGGGGGAEGSVAGGGGGGYSGGSSGSSAADSCGGGGGSYNAGTNQQNECCFNTAGHGHVTITLL